MLKTNRIDVYYSDVQVLWDLSFEVKQGEIVALIGANGAGKSTTLKTISGLLKPQAGEILFEETHIHKIEPYKLIEFGIVHVPEGRRLFPEMTVEENLETGALKGEAKKTREQTKEIVYEFFPILKDRRKQLAGTLSGGEQQMAAIGRGIMSKPKFLMLDEPSLGLAPILVKEIFIALKKMRDTGTTILLVEQNTKQTLAIADRGYVLENGKIVMEGAASNLLNNEYVKKAFLGV